MLGLIKQGLLDFSVSRTSITWGIPLPWDPKHVTYVWFDALVNYCTAVGYGSDPEQFARYWPANYHLIGKDILRQHAVYWPAMLMAAGEAPPQHVYAHGFLLVGGEKMSKTRMNQIAPADLVAEFGVDGYRYHFIADQRFGPDGDFSYEAMVARYNSDLANNFGNLASRVLNMAANYVGGATPDAREDGPLVQSSVAAFDGLRDGIDALDFSGGFGALWQLIKDANAYIEDRQPWVLAQGGRRGRGRRGARRLSRGAADRRAARVAGDPACRRGALASARSRRHAGGAAAARRGGMGERGHRGQPAREGRRPLPAPRPSVTAPDLGRQPLPPARGPGRGGRDPRSGPGRRGGVGGLRGDGSGDVTGRGRRWPGATTTSTPRSGSTPTTRAGSTPSGRRSSSSRRTRTSSASAKPASTSTTTTRRTPSRKPRSVRRSSSRTRPIARSSSTRAKHGTTRSACCATKAFRRARCSTASPVDPTKRAIALDLGTYLSFSGIVTFKTADDVRAAAALAPLERVLVETDSPYLAPVPHRGSTNEPAYVAVVGAGVAAARGATGRRDRGGDRGDHGSGLPVLTRS